MRDPGHGQPRQISFVRVPQDSFIAWCESCGQVVPALTPESYSLALRVSASMLDELIDAERLHAVEMGARSVLICGETLSTYETTKQLPNHEERAL